MGSYEVVVDDSGVATVVWKHRVDDTFTVQSASSSGGSWSSVATLGGSSQRLDPDLSLDAAGNAAVAWTDFTSGAVLARRPAQGSWGTPVALDGRPGMDSFGPAADTAAGGDIVAVWAGYSDETKHAAPERSGLRRRRAAGERPQHPGHRDGGHAGGVLGHGGRRLVRGRLDVVVPR